MMYSHCATCHSGQGASIKASSTISRGQAMLNHKSVALDCSNSCFMEENAKLCLKKKDLKDAIYKRSRRKHMKTHILG